MEKQTEKYTDCGTYDATSIEVRRIGNRYIAFAGYDSDVSFSAPSYEEAVTGLQRKLEN